MHRPFPKPPVNILFLKYIQAGQPSGLFSSLTGTLFENDFRGGFSFARTDAGPDFFRNIAVDGGLRTIRLGGNHRRSGIRHFTDGNGERHFAEERHANPLSLCLGTAMAENIITRAGIRCDEVAHILDDAEQRHFHLAEHGDALARVDQRQILRRGDDDGAA